MADLTPDERKEAETVMARLQDDDIQQKLSAGFERDFSDSVLEQWVARKWLSFGGRNGKKSQIEIVRDILSRCEDRIAGRGSQRRGGTSRREGYHGSRY